jgi:hypothetical protein
VDNKETGQAETRLSLTAAVILWSQGIFLFALYLAIALGQGLLIRTEMMTTILLVIEAVIVFGWLFSRKKGLQISFISLLLFVLLVWSGYYIGQWYWTQTIFNLNKVAVVNRTAAAIGRQERPILKFSTAAPDLKYLSEYRHDFSKSHQNYALAPVVDKDWDSTEMVNVWAFVDLKRYDVSLLEDKHRIGLIIKDTAFHRKKAIAANIAKYHLISNPRAIWVEWVNPTSKLKQNWLFSQYSILGLLILWTISIGWLMISNQKRKH